MKNLRLRRVLSSPGERQRLLELSDERDVWLQRLLDTWREAFLLGAKSRAGDYEAGFADGVMAYKRAQHDAVRLVDEEMARWDGWRENFGKPRPGDYPGRS